MPTAVILMELVYELYQARHMLAHTHSRRDCNPWADGLTHPDPKGFCSTLRGDISPILSLIPKVLESGNVSMWTDNPGPCPPVTSGGKVGVLDPELALFPLRLPLALTGEERTF